MISELQFRLLRGKESNPQRLGARREALLLPVFVEPDPNNIWGVDTSHWDGNVNFDVTKAAGASFAFIKCMDGTVATAYFRANFQRAQAAGLLVSGYGWLYPDRIISCKLQAQRIWELTRDLDMTLPLVIDFEWTRYAGQSANPNYDDLRKWTAEYNRLSGKKAILYSAAGYMNLFGAMPADLRELFFGVWWASYGGTTPILPRGFNHWDCWQFSANGDARKLAPGDTGKRELDLNYMTPEFYKRVGGTVVQEPELPPIGEDSMRYTVTWSGGVARRTAPHTGTASQGTYTGLSYTNGQTVDVVQDNIPDQIEPTNPNKKWVKFAQKTADGRDLYGASEYPDSAGVPRVRMTKVQEPDPEPEPSPTAPEPFTLNVRGFKPFSGTLDPE